MSDEEYLILPPLTETNRPNGNFFSGFFYWLQPYGLADYEEEWGRKHLDGISYAFAASNPFYDKTGNIRPFSDMNELRSRRLRAAQHKAEETWNVVGYRIEKMVFDEASKSSESVSVSIKEIFELL